MTKAELFRKLMLLPIDIEADFIGEGGITDATDSEFESYTARIAVERYQGFDLGERPRLLVLLPHGLRSIARVDEELDAAFEEIRQMQELLGENGF